MPELTVSTVRADGVTFVEAVVLAERPTRIRLDAHVDGPVWPPRTDGRPKHDWSGGSTMCQISAGRTAFGFATPAAVDGPALELTTAKQLAEGELPDGIEAWLERIERRVERAEQLADSEGLLGAAEAVESIGGLDEVERLSANISRDRRLVERFSFVPDSLCERLERVDVPALTFARILDGL